MAVIYHCLARKVNPEFLRTPLTTGVARLFGFYRLDEQRFSPAPFAQHGQYSGGGNHRCANQSGERGQAIEKQKTIIIDQTIVV